MFCFRVEAEHSLYSGYMQTPAGKVTCIAQVGKRSCCYYLELNFPLGLKWFGIFLLSMLLSLGSSFPGTLAMAGGPWIKNHHVVEELDP